MARQGINLLVHGKSASAFVAWNKAGAESNHHAALPFVGVGDPGKLRASFRPTLRGGVHES